MPYLFPNASENSGKFQRKHVHGGNHAPSTGDWFANDDTLDRQGVDPSRPRGHGICKGIASSWVMSFLNNVSGASTTSQYEKFYEDFLRFQATMVKDFGGHIDEHAAQFAKIGLDSGIKSTGPKDIVTFTEADCGSGRWAAYISVWGHDIAIGGLWGAGGKLYINEPNTGLMAYNTTQKFLDDLNGYNSQRRASKGRGPDVPARYWFCTAN